MDNRNRTNQANLEIQQSQLAAPSRQNPRQGWEEAFRLMAARGEDQLLDADMLQPTEWDKSEWEWDTDATSSNEI